MTQTLKTLIPLTIVFALLVATNFIYAAWSAPGGAPSAGNNALAPINVGSDSQVKNGALAVDGLAVFGAANIQTEVQSPSYCDENGANCFSPSAVSGTSGTSTFTVTTHSIRSTPGHCTGGDAVPNCVMSKNLGQKDFCALTTYSVNANYRDGDNNSCSVAPDGGGDWIMTHYRNRYMRRLTCAVSCIGSGGIADSTDVIDSYTGSGGDSDYR